MIGPNRLWLLFFGFWLVLLSGGLNTRVGPPGLTQYMKLRSFLNERTQTIQNLSAELHQLRNVRQNLEKNPFAQIKEIRKTLGYVGKNEIIFEY